MVYPAGWLKAGMEILRVPALVSSVNVSPHGKREDERVEGNSADMIGCRGWTLPQTAHERQTAGQTKGAMQCGDLGKATSAT